MLRAALELLLQVGFSGFLEAKVCVNAGFSCLTLSFSKSRENARNNHSR
jgi:hypothetical protein